MMRKVVWLVLGSLVTLSLVLAACAPAAPPTPKEEAAVEKVEMVTNALGKRVEKPQYGGSVTIPLPAPIPGYDHAVAGARPDLQFLTFEELTEGDWTRSGAGTDELSFLAGPMIVWRTANVVPCLAESWEFPDSKTVVVHLRKGVTWANKPPMNGRELTSEDVVDALNRWWYLPTAYGTLWVGDDLKPTDIKIIDRYTVSFKNEYGKMGGMLPNQLDWNMVWPKDAVQLYGDLNKWENAHGSGPFIITEVIPGTSYTLKRNPNYWRQNPLYPDMPMPFIDTVKFLVIEDLSTRLAALRTAQIDWMEKIVREDADLLMVTNPELKFKRYLTRDNPSIVMRIDKPELPWYNKKVRHALQMAINRQEIKDFYYKGDASIFEFPVNSYEAFRDEAFKDAHIPLDKLPQSVQELFQYKPDKTRQLLTEAGYPKGFKARVVARAKDADLLSVIKEYWAAIGVDLEIQVKEAGVYGSILAGRTHDEMIVHDRSGALLQMADYWMPTAYQNLSFIVTPETKALADEVLVDWMDWDRIIRAWKVFTPYILDVADTVSPPAPFIFSFWQPWLRDYNAEFAIGHWDWYEFPKYIWIDQKMKETMTGKK